MGAHADLCVVGAGAAGLFAAWWAARTAREAGKELRVLLLEKNLRPGLKILISGGGRCNLTTTRQGKDLERQYGRRRGLWLRHALRAFPPQDLVSLIESRGVRLHEEDLEKIFPVSRRAKDVLDALLGLCEEAGVEVCLGRALTGVQREGEGFALQTSEGSMRCRRLVLSTGGLSYPKTGATGDGYGFCRGLGHRITPCVPALAPLRVDQPWVHQLAGIVLPDPVLRLHSASGERLLERQRPLLFTHKGLSGPAAMDLSGAVEEREEPCELRLDLVPGRTRQQLDAGFLQAAQEQPRRRVSNLLPRTLPERLREHLCQAAGADTTLAELPRAARQRLLESLKQTRIPVRESLGFGAAEVTRGGVELEEVDARSMQSRVCPGLYICGELLDIDGPIGGFNFQAAFATARLAGIHASRSLLPQ